MPFITRIKSATAKYVVKAKQRHTVLSIPIQDFWIHKVILTFHFINAILWCTPENFKLASVIFSVDAGINTSFVVIHDTHTHTHTHTRTHISVLCINVCDRKVFHEHHKNLWKAAYIVRINTFTLSICSFTERVDWLNPLAFCTGGGSNVASELPEYVDHYKVWRVKVFVDQIRWMDMWLDKGIKVYLNMWTSSFLVRPLWCSGTTYTNWVQMITPWDKI